MSITEAKATGSQITNKLASENNMDQLSKDVASLKTDVASLITTLKDIGRAEGKAARASVEANADLLQKRLVAAGENAQEVAAELPAQTRTLVRQNPMAAVLIAAAAGAVFGLATGRK